MAWEGDTAFRDLPAMAPGPDAQIELVGTYLRLTGRIPLGRFARLTDLINALSGYVHIHDAQLLRLTGEPAGLVLPEIMVDQGRWWVARPRERVEDLFAGERHSP